MSELFLTILNMNLTASYVILFVIFIRLLLKRAPKFISYALWAVVAFRLIIPFSFESIFSLMPGHTNVVPISHDIIYQQSSQINSGIGVVDSFVNNSLPAPTIGASMNPLQIYVEIGAYIWILGIIALLVYSLVSVLILKRQLKNAQLIEKNIFQARNLKTPFVLGLIKPKIYLPDRLNATERSYILLHEQTHICRKDHIIKVLAFLTLSVHWFNPLVWTAFILMSTDMELSCDERVLKEMNEDIKKPYANSLLSLATGRYILNGSPLAFGEGNVRGRIKNVLNYKRPRFWVIVLAIVVVTAVGIGLMTNPKGKNSTVLIDSSDVLMKHIQVEVTKLGTKVLTGVVVTDKDSYKAGDIITVAIGEGVSYDLGSLVVGDWIDIDYKMVREKDPTEFVAVHLNRITGHDYPTTFSLIENGNIVESNTLMNPRVASEMPALILSGSPDSSLRIDSVSDSLRYLKIEIGSFGDKTYYAFEKDGKYYVGNDNMHGITHQTFDELMQYVYKKEITVIGKNTDIKKFVEDNLSVILSSPKESSNPQDYINAHQEEYENFFKYGGEEALQYILTQFETGNVEGLRGQILMKLCNELLGARNNVIDDSLSPQEWYDTLSIRQEIILPNYEYDGEDSIERLVYDTEIERDSWSNKRGSFIIVAPKIFGSYAEENLLKVFVTTYSARYKLYGNTLSEEGGSIIPAAITYRKDDNGRYVLVKYEQARDGSEFGPSVREYCTMPVSKKEIKGLADKVFRHYTDTGDISTLLYDNLFRHLKKNGITEATITNSRGEIEFSTSNPKYKP